METTSTTFPMLQISTIGYKIYLQIYFPDAGDGFFWVTYTVFQFAIDMIVM